MYWPAGAPRIYSANSSDSTRQIIEFIDRSKSYTIVEGNNFYHPNENEKALCDENADDLERLTSKSETATPSTLKTPILTTNSVSQDNKLSHNSSHLTVKGNPSINLDDQSLLSLKISRSGHLFAVISSTSLTIWQTKVCLKS